MIKDLVQATLDAALYTKGIYVYDQRKSGQDADEYVVYSASGDLDEFHADDAPIIKNASVTIRHYYREEKLETHAARTAIRANDELIASTLGQAGFELPNGFFDAGDVDDIGYLVTVFECEYWRAV